jgi:hypothetical protein
MNTKRQYKFFEKSGFSKKDLSETQDGTGQAPFLL